MMRDSCHELIADPISEARRYVDNANDLLRDHGQLNYETQLYQDKKYVRMAGNTLWNGMLLILDAVFGVKNNHHPHPDIKDYRSAIAKRDHKLLDLVNAAYDTMHITMGYDGNVSKALCSDGIRLANDIIERCEAMLRKAA